MARARLETEWDRTVTLEAKIHNVNCVKTSDMISNPSLLNPLRNPGGLKKIKLELKEIRAAMEGE